MGQPASWPRFLGESFGSGLAIGGRPLGLAGFAFATPLLFLARDGSSDTSAGVLLLAIEPGQPRCAPGPPAMVRGCTWYFRRLLNSTIAGVIVGARSRSDRSNPCG